MQVFTTIFLAETFKANIDHVGEVDDQEISTKPAFSSSSKHSGSASQCSRPAIGLKITASKSRSRELAMIVFEDR